MAEWSTAGGLRKVTARAPSRSSLRRCAYETVQRSEVRVMEGDTLSSIAGRVLGRSGDWKMIWRQNDNISDPDRLEVGSVIFYIEPGSVTAQMETQKKDAIASNDLEKEVAADAEIATQMVEKAEKVQTEEFVSFGNNDLEFMI